MIVDLLLAEAAASPGWLEPLTRWARMESAAELWLLVFGVVGQVTFFARWLVQWVASEVRGESHIPLLFWWLSLAGASMLLLYFILRREPVGVLGQSVGWIVYGRNLWLLRRRHDRLSAAPASSGDG